MKVWIVDTGAYANNHIDKIFLTQEAADSYAAWMNAEAENKAAGGYRSMDDYWSVAEHEVEV